MRKSSRFLTIVFCSALIITYILIGFVHVSMVKNVLQKQVSDTITYSAKQVSQIIEARIREDEKHYKELIMVDEVTSITCEDDICNPGLRLNHMRTVLDNEIVNGNILRFGIFNFVHDGVILLNSQGSTSHFVLDVSDEFFDESAHILSFNNVISPVDYQEEYQTGEVMYLNQVSDQEYIFISRPKSILNDYFKSLPFNFEKQIYLIGYIGVEDEETNFTDGLIYFSDKASGGNNLIELLDQENSVNVVTDVKQNLINKQAATYELKLKGSTNLVYIEPFFGDNDIVHFVFTTPNSVINTLVSDLQVTSLILTIFSITILLIFIFLVYRILLRRINDANTNRILNNLAKAYIIEINKDGRIVYHNSLFTKSIKRYRHNINEYEFYGGIDFRTSRKTYEPFTIKDVSRDGKDIYIRFSVLKKFKKYELIGQNITKDINQMIMMKEIAFSDSLTNLPNKKALIIEINSILDDFDLEKKNSLLVINIVQFKNINNLFGREFGDLVLKEVSNILKTEVGQTGGIFRLEGDSYGILLKNIESYAFAIDMAKRIASTFSKAFTITGNDIKLQLKLGIFNVQKDNEHELNADKIISNAYLAANYIQDSKRTNYYVYDHNLAVTFIKDDIMSKDLKQALTNNEFEVYYQPQYSLKLKKIIGFEALIRWRNPKYRDESPLKYIEMAEKNGMINDIGDFVLEETLKFAKMLRGKGVHISINVSPVQLMQVGFISDFLKLYDSYKLEENSICVEITETYLINNFEEVIEKLKILKEHGIHVHLDDFGSGYSSMQYLKDLPINAIKIDKEFTKGIEIDKYSRVIVSKLLNMSKELGLYAIVEGVETNFELNYLTKINCEIIQGYIIGKAMPLDAAITTLRDFNINSQTDSLKKTKKNV